MFPDLPTVFIGKTILSFEALPSTNEYALELLSKSGPTEGTVISTQNQTAGRGQFGNSWHSASGQNVACSIILTPHFLRPQQQFLLSQVYSLAVCETVSHFLPDETPLIKWPNDTVINERKVAGILIQNNLQQKKIRYSVGGVGINVNQTRFDDLPQAGSMYLFSGKRTDPSDVLSQLFQRLEFWYLALRRGKARLVENSYHKLLFGLEEKRWYLLPEGRKVQGIIKGTDPSGKLRVEIDEKMHAFDLKQITYTYESKDH